MPEDITLKDVTEEMASSWDVLVEVDDETYEMIEIASAGEELIFKVKLKRGYTGVDRSKILVKPQYPCATNGAVTIEDVTLNGITAATEEKKVRDIIEVKGMISS